MLYRDDHGKSNLAMQPVDLDVDRTALQTARCRAGVSGAPAISWGKKKDKNIATRIPLAAQTHPPVISTGVSAGADAPICSTGLSTDPAHHSRYCSSAIHRPADDPLGRDRRSGRAERASMCGAGMVWGQRAVWGAGAIVGINRREGMAAQHSMFGLVSVYRAMEGPATA